MKWHEAEDFLSNFQNRKKMEETEENRYQVLCCNIHWDNRARSAQSKRMHRPEDLPSQMAIDIPDSVLAQANKNGNNFNDIIEQFCYNLLTRKYGYEMNSCQVWLPLS